LGLALSLVGVIILAYALTPQPVPPVDVNLDQSGIRTTNGVYFDSIIIHNHGSSNVTVVVEIQTPLDTKPRLSDPITLCANCTGTLTIEEVQPAQNQTSNQYAYYTYALMNPQSIRVEYLSTVLHSHSTGIYPEVGAGIMIIGLFLTIYSASRSRERSSTKPDSAKRPRKKAKSK